MINANTNQRPFPKSYWVIPARFLAGEYPGAPDANLAKLKLRRLLDLGITFIIDLTADADPLLPYESLLKNEAAERGLAYGYRRLSIPDFDVPSPEHMRLILDTIDGALKDGRMVYLHCWGGSGRTGTVVGCWLVRHGKPGDEALAEITRLRQVIPAYDRRDSPETSEQDAMVRDWKESK